MATKFTSKVSFSGVTGTAVPSNLNNTDLVAPVIKLYLEGVEVRFESIQINQTYRQKPTADIQIPPESGLLDIIRGYEPKVHIFYEDANYGGLRLLFWGRAVASSYSRSRGAGSTSISFHCEHKNTLLNQMTLDYTGWASPLNDVKTDNNSAQNMAKPAAFNSTAMIIEALAGISGVATAAQTLSQTNPAVKDAPVDKLDQSLAALEERLQGMPGVAISLWNQIKKEAMKDPQGNMALTKMYIPLIEEGLSYFKRMSGHTLIEGRMQTDKRPYCHQGTKEEKVIMTPPCFQTPLISATQRTTAVQYLSSQIGFSGELTSFEALLSMFYEGAQYDLITLASPAEVPVKPGNFTERVTEAGLEKMAIETIVKPRVPFYFTPVCNVLLPRMYSSLQINQDESSMPTRLAATHDSYPGQSGNTGLGINFRAPHSVREAIAYNALLKGVTSTGARETEVNLGATKALSYSMPGKYEQGLGIRPSRLVLPWWLALLSADRTSQGPRGNQEEYPPKGTREYSEMMALTAEWKNRYGVNIIEKDGVLTVNSNGGKNGLNPFDPNNKSVQPFERMMFSMIDYEYSKLMAGTRSGFVEAVFNPYVIPGYPIDIIDESPNHPSFHGFCSSVTHSFTPSSMYTSIGVVAMSTYAELSNYYIPPLPPFLSTALSLVNAEVDEPALEESSYGDSSPFTSPRSTLIQNPVAKAAADKFYQQVLGVGCVAPDDLIHMSSGRAYPVARLSGVLVPKVLPGAQNLPNTHPHNFARQDDDYYSTVGNLRLVRRPIESKSSIEDKFGLKFIDLNPLLYNVSYANYVNPKLASNFFLEPGASLFLDYQEVQDFIRLELGFR